MTLKDTVHFSPDHGPKEFFLVVSFSSAYFPLDEASVGLALQCCIGGDSLGFRVYKLSDRRFWFSVASNKVGHFICGVQDRVWPDFVCHLTLYRGDAETARLHVDEAASAWLAGAFDASRQLPIRSNSMVAHRDLSCRRDRSRSRSFKVEDLFHGALNFWLPRAQLDHGRVDVVEFGVH